MTRLPLAFAVAASAALVAPSITFAGSPRVTPHDTPSPPNAEIPCGIVLVGTAGGFADPKGEFAVIIRNLANDPIEGSHIVVDFTGCSPDIRISDVQPWPGLSVDCSAPIGVVQGISDANGTVIMSIVGGANNLASRTPAAGFKCAAIYADGVLLGSVNVGAYDQNGVGGVNPVDISMWLHDSFTDTFEGRSDFNCSQTINPGDLSWLLQVSLVSSSHQSAAHYCH